MVLDHAQRTFQEIFRYVNNGDLSEESVDYLRYKSEVALNILQMSCLVYNIPSSLIDQAQDIYVTLEEAWKEFQCGTSSNTVRLEHVFSGSPGRLAFHIPKEGLEMFVENKFSINAMARMLEVSESTVKRRLYSFGISISFLGYHLQNAEEAEDASSIIISGSGGSAISFYLPWIKIREQKYEIKI